MNTLPYEEDYSTGERYVTVDIDKRIALNNQIISIEEAKRFLKYINEADIKLNFSNRKTKNQWGTAFPISRRIILYRHSVWMFLHELSHILSPILSNHDRIFSENLDNTFKKYVEWICKEQGIILES